jgi:hypothetical protein
MVQVKFCPRLHAEAAVHWQISPNSIPLGGGWEGITSILTVVMNFHFPKVGIKLLPVVSTSVRAFLPA